MRARNIKPGFFKNEELAECSLPARLLFPGLWLMADREGRLEDRVKRIDAEIFPYDNFDVNALLNELVDHGFIARYEVDGKKYIQIINFVKHQNPHKNDAASEIPDMSEATPKITRSTPEITGVTPAESLLLNLESLNLESLNLDNAQPPVEQNSLGVPEETSKKPKKVPKARSEDDVLFVQFWAAYPRRVDKIRAFEVWQRIPQAEREDTVTAAKAYAAEAQRLETEPQFIKHPSTFLNKETWKDYVKGPPLSISNSYNGVSEEERRAIFAKYRDSEGFGDLKAATREIRALERERGFGSVYGGVGTG